MEDKKKIRIKTRRTWGIKPFQRVERSGKTYSRKGDPLGLEHELDEGDESRIVGLDVGLKRTGVAISDPLGITAQPLGVLDSEEAIPRLKELTGKRQISLFVIGHPLGMDGKRGKSAKMVEEFAQKLEDATNVPYRLVDERLSSRAGERALREMGRKPSRDKGAVDQIAAVIILQSYLDRATRMNSEDEHD
jgi:putative Holliday junction resolvase